MLYLHYFRGSKRSQFFYRFRFFVGFFGAARASSVRYECLETDDFFVNLLNSLKLS